MNLQNIYISTEFDFKKLYHYFPDELYIKLLNLGMTKQSFKPLQKEMDRLFALQKIQSEFEQIEESPF